MSVYYNEHDKNAAAWLRELVAGGLIPAGEVDERSICDVQADDVRHYSQRHWYAGIGGWARALQLAGWPVDQPIDTLSCPCPPFSCAGKKKLCPVCGGKPMPHPYQIGIFACVPCGHEWFADARHLWPESRRLIEQLRPAVCVGEQVAGGDGLVWLAGVRATLEELGYGVGASDLCAAGVSAPHIRQRLYWVARRVADPQGNQRGWRERNGDQAGRDGLADGCETNREGLAHSEQPGLEGHRRHEHDGNQPGRDGAQTAGSIAQGGAVGGVGEPHGAGSQPGQPATAPARYGGALDPAGDAGGVGDAGLSKSSGRHGEASGSLRGALNEPSSPSGGNFWSRYRVIPCRDGKARRIPESGIFPLAYGFSGGVGSSGDSGVTEDEANQTKEARVMRLKGYGNAINPVLAAEFILAVMETARESREGHE